MVNLRSHYELETGVMPSPHASPTAAAVGAGTITTALASVLRNCSSLGGCNGTEAPGVGAGAGAVYPLEPALALVSVVSLIIVATIVGNVLVVIAVFTSRGLRAPQNLFLVSLASADILVATLVMPFSLANELMGYWYFGPVWCEIYLALDVLFCTSSIVHLCAISLDRYWSITQAVQYNLKRTPRRIKCIIVVVWVIAAVISFPPLVPIGRDPGQEQSPDCRINQEEWYIISSCIGSFFAPCVIMILVYVRIYQIAKVRTRHPAAGGGRRCREDGAPGGGGGAGVGGAGAVAAGAPGGGKAAGAKRNGIADGGAPGGDKPAANGSENAAGGRREEPEDGFEMDESTSSDHHQTHCSAGKKTPRGQQTPAPSAPAGPRGEAKPSQPGGQGVSEPDRTGAAAGAGGAGAGATGGSPKWKRWRGRQNREKRFTFVLSVVIGVFIVCWFPFFFTYSLTAICKESCPVPERLFKFFFWFGYCNSSLNPIIYTIFNQDFRRAFQKILCRGRRRQRV